MSPLESISQFHNPTVPDLGCFLRRKHGFKTDQAVDFENVHVDFNPSIDYSPKYHQTYFRVVCGEAAFFKRCLVYMTNDASIPPSVIQNFPPGFILGGDYTPRPSEWNRFPTQSGERFYWFVGQNRNPAAGTWQADALVGHSCDIYENGRLSTVQYDNTGNNGDSDDLILEVAIVGRRSWGDLSQAANQPAVNKKIQDQGIPRLRELLDKRGK